MPSIGSCRSRNRLIPSLEVGSWAPASVHYCWIAHAGVACANALQQEPRKEPMPMAVRVRALAAYKDFLTLWKDADPDIPIMKQAKAEYTKLQ